MRYFRLILLYVSIMIFCLPNSIMAQIEAPPPRYQVTDFGALTTFPNSRVYDLNEKGQVVGQVAKVDIQREAHAVLWSNGKVITIALPKDLSYGVASAINDHGAVVGGSELQNYGSTAIDISGMADRAFKWQDSHFLELPMKSAKEFFNLDTSHAYAINNQGQIAGVSERRAVIWTQGKQIILPIPPQCIASTAGALNEQGTTVGYILSKDNKRQAVRWKLGKYQRLAIPTPYDESTSCAINEAGQVVGSYGKDRQNDNLACLWQNGKMTKLPSLDGGVWHNQAIDINDHGQIVGYGMYDIGYMHAVLWEKNFPFDLNDLIPKDTGLVLVKAVAINNHGQIAGEARDSKGNTHAILLTPLKKTVMPIPQKPQRGCRLPSKQCYIYLVRLITMTWVETYTWYLHFISGSTYGTVWKDGDSPAKLAALKQRCNGLEQRLTS